VLIIDQMKYQYNYLVILFIIIFSFFLQNCGSDESEPCKDCVNNEVKSEVKDLYVRFLHNANRDTVLVSTDSITMESTRHFVCNTELLRNIELTKILKINGESLETCKPEEDELISLDKLEIIDFCHVQGKEVEGEFPFFGVWLVNYIATSDTTLLPPCEGNLPYINFVENSSNLNVFPHQSAFFGASINSNLASFNINTLNLIEPAKNILMTTAGPGTRANGYFDNLFFPFLQGNMTYSITNNIMTITNTTNKNIINLYNYEVN
jgi:hypothetical protein